MTGEDVNAAWMAFKKALIERALAAELGHHLGYSNGAVKLEAVSNQRTGAPRPESVWSLEIGPGLRQGGEETPPLSVAWHGSYCRPP